MGLNIVDINVFLFNVYKRFYFCHVFNVFLVFFERFSHLCCAYVCLWSRTFFVWCYGTDSWVDGFEKYCS